MSDALFFVETRWGGSEEAPSNQRMRELIAELSIKDEEHPDTWLVHGQSGWLLRLDEDGYAYLEDQECTIVSHMERISPEFALQLWIRFSVGGPESVAKEPWKSGRPSLNQQVAAERQALADESLLRIDREFFDELGSEVDNTTCKSPGCRRGHIKYGVLCRAHHFEQIRKRECPFID